MRSSQERGGLFCFYSVIVCRARTDGVLGPGGACVLAPEFDGSVDFRPLRFVVFRRHAESYRWSQLRGLHKSVGAFSVSGAWSVVELEPTVYSAPMGPAYWRLNSPATWTSSIPPGVFRRHASPTAGASCRGLHCASRRSKRQSQGSPSSARPPGALRVQCRQRPTGIAACNRSPSRASGTREGG